MRRISDMIADIKALNNISKKLAKYDMMRENVRINSEIIREITARLSGYDGLNENVRNNNAVIEWIREKLGEHDRLGENVRNNNAAIEGITERLSDYDQVRENLSGNNAVIEWIREKLGEHDRLGENVRNNNAAIEGITERLSDYDQVRENLSGNNAVIEWIREKLGEHDRLGENVRGNNARLDSQNSMVDKLSTICELQKVKISLLEKQLKNYGIQNDSKVTDETVGKIYEDRRQNAYSAIDYFDFENHFRGSMQHIRKTQEFYVKYFEGCENVIDLGCGRGEFLELLRENGIDSQGVDLYEEFVEMCRLKDLRVVCADAIEFLRGQETVGGIFAAQLIEHISTNQLVTLCELAYEKLEEGGCIILETPNPRSLSIFTNAFYIDPSHNKPVHPLTVQYILQKAGFSEIEIIYTESSRPRITIPPIAMENMEEFNRAMQQVEEMLFGSQDYAVVARR